ncbi:MAG: OmpH family outer membrane protein [Veillonellaceae bacterium]|nr:OmpH family outer membrane protein [Veillonellaceae bacterium]
MVKTAMMTAALAVGTLVGAAAADIGVVDFDLAAQSHPQYAAMRQQAQKVEREYAPRLEAMQTDLGGMKTDADREAAVQDKYQALIESFLKARNQVMAPVMGDVEKAVEAVRAEKKLVAVMDVPVSIVVKDAKTEVVDVTPLVQQKLKK